MRRNLARLLFWTFIASTFGMLCVPVLPMSFAYPLLLVFVGSLLGAMSFSQDF